MSTHPIAFVTFKSNSSKRYAIKKATNKTCRNFDTGEECAFFNTINCTSPTEGLCLYAGVFFVEAPRDNQE